MKFHVCADIYGLLQYSNKKLGKIFSMSGQEARRQLKDLASKGHQVIPSQGCDNFDPFEHGCLGHTETGEKNPCTIGRFGPLGCEKAINKSCEGCEHYQPACKKQPELAEELL